jgi:type VI protein secretion system component VasF
MDQHAQHHQHHEKEREEKIKHEKERERNEDNQIRKMHPAWFVGLGVVLIFAVVFFWIWVAS